MRLSLSDFQRIMLLPNNELSEHLNRAVRIGLATEVDVPADADLPTATESEVPPAVDRDARDVPPVDVE